MARARQYIHLLLQFVCGCIPLPYLIMGLCCFVVYAFFAKSHGLQQTLKTGQTTLGGNTAALRSVIEAFMTIPVVESQATTDGDGETAPKRRGGGGTGYAHESEARRYVEELFGLKFPKSRPSWLINPETGHRMELDMYCESLNLAIEYDGAQHEHYTPHWHRTYDVFEKQKKRDKEKGRICESNGIHLIRIPYNIPYEHLGSYIEGGLNGIPVFRNLLMARRSGGNTGHAKNTTNSDT